MSKLEMEEDIEKQYTEYVCGVIRNVMHDNAAPLFRKEDVRYRIHMHWIANSEHHQDCYFVSVNASFVLEKLKKEKIGLVLFTEPKLRILSEVVEALTGNVLSSVMLVDHNNDPFDSRIEWLFCPESEANKRLTSKEYLD